MSEQLCILAATESDARVIAEHRYHGTEFSEADLAAYEEWVRQQISEQTYAGYVARAGDVIVAGAGAVLLDWGPTRGNPHAIRARVVNVCTELPWRGKGIAESLVVKVIEHCEILGIHDFCLAAAPASASLYARLGFFEYSSEMRRLKTR